LGAAGFSSDFMDPKGILHEKVPHGMNFLPVVLVAVAIEVVKVSPIALSQ
jgi:hypothetical protein